MGSDVGWLLFAPAWSRPHHCTSSGYVRVCKHGKETDKQSGTKTRLLVRLELDLKKKTCIVSVMVAVTAVPRRARPTDAPEAAAVVDVTAASPTGDTAGRTARRSRGSAEAGAALAALGVAATEARAPPDAAADADGSGVPAALAGEAADGGTVDVSVAVTGVAAMDVVAGVAAGAAAGC